MRDDWYEDDEWRNDEPPPRLVRFTYLVDRLIAWKNGLTAVWREDDLDVDWDGFARTKGAFIDWSWGGFCWPLEKTYNLELTSSSVLMKASGFCVPPPADPEWQPWADYYPMPPFASLESCLPTFRAQRGGIRFVAETTDKKTT